MVHVPSPFSSMVENLEAAPAGDDDFTFFPATPDGLSATNVRRLLMVVVDVTLQIKMKTFYAEHMVQASPLHSTLVLVEGCAFSVIFLACLAALVRV